MKKRITILLATCLLLVGVSFGQRTLDLEISPDKLTTRSDDTKFRADNEQIVFSYATGLNFVNIAPIGPKLSDAAIFAMAIDLPNDVYKGLELAGATVHISRDPSTETLPSNLKLIVVDASSEMLIAEKKVITPIEEGLNTIILDEPLKIEEGKSYQVGYVIAKAASESSASWFSFDLDAPSLPASNRSIIIEETSDEPDTWNFEDISELEFGSLAIFPLINTTDDTWKNVASTSKFEFYRFAQTGSKQSIGEMHTMNRGFTDITSAVFSYQIEDGSAVEEVVDFSSTPIKPGYMFPVEVLATLSEPKLTPIKAQLISVNGSDNNLLPTDTYSGKIIVEPAGGSTTMNSVLYERFTTEQCVNCPSADGPEQISRKELEESGIKVSRIAHHVGYSTDWLTNRDSNPLLNLLKIPGAPIIAINRYVSDEEVYNVNPMDVRKSIKHAKRSIRRTTAEITSVEQAYDKNSQKLAVKVEGKAYANIDSDNLFVNIVITESDIKARNQEGAGSDYMHEDVPRIFATGTYGEKTAITGGTFSMEVKDIEIPKGYKTDNMKVVVFLSRNLEPTGYTWDINIYDSKTELLTADDSTEEVGNLTEVFVTSRDGAIIIEGEYNSALAYDLAGRQVAQTDLAAGVYIVRVETPQGIVVRKVAVR